MRARATRIHTAVWHAWPLVVALLVLSVAAPALGASSRGSAPGTQGAIGTGRRPAASPIGAHSMLYLNTPFSAMRAMFAQARAMGASEIRVDIELSAVFPGPSERTRRSGALTTLMGARRSRRIGSLRKPPRRPGPLAHPDWSGVNRYMRLARQYQLRPLAVLTATPWDMADCPKGTPSRDTYRCPPKNPRVWGRAAGRIAAHTRGVIDDFEILNEPDGGWSFLGSARQYAAMLADSYDAIHAADGNARVAFGGLEHYGWRGRRWMNRMLTAPGTDAAHKFDLANVHLRVPPTVVAGFVCQWRSYLAQKGFHGPLWVTETGYPADPDQQPDPGYQSGLQSQTRWLASVIPAMLATGVAKVFVTERDLRGRYGSEGVLKSPDPLPPSPRITRRPSFYAVQWLARGAWPSAEQRYAQRSQGGGCPQLTR